MKRRWYGPIFAAVGIGLVAAAVLATLTIPVVQPPPCHCGASVCFCPAESAPTYNLTAPLLLLAAIIYWAALVAARPLWRNPSKSPPPQAA